MNVVLTVVTTWSLFLKNRITIMYMKDFIFILSHNHDHRNITRSIVINEGIECGINCEDQVET